MAKEAEKLRHALGFGYFSEIPLLVIHQKKREATGRHSHDFMELVVVSSGRAKHDLCGELHTVSAGDVFVIAPHQWHQYTDCKAFDYYDIIFEPRALGLQQADIASLRGYHALFSIEPYLRERNCLPAGLKLDQKQLAHTVGVLETIIREMESDKPGKFFCATANFMQLVINLCRCYETVGHNLLGDSPKGAQTLLGLADVLSYIELNLTNRISVDELAARAMLSRSSFIRSFESVVGKPPLEYINTRRLQGACHRLRHTTDPIGQIAYDSGFGDSNYFSRYFKSRMGISPRQYRNRHDG